MRFPLLSALLITLSLGGTAMAQPHDRGPHVGPPSAGHGGPPPQAQGRPGGPPPGHNYQRPDNRRPVAPPRHADHHRPGYGAGPDRNWVEGSRLPPAYRGRYYVVDNWRGHGLRPPPRGHHWVQYGADYLLVAISTGVITSLIIHSAY